MDKLKRRARRASSVVVIMLCVAGSLPGTSASAASGESIRKARRPVTTMSKLERAYRANTISADEYLLTGIRSLMNMDRVPTPFRAAKATSGSHETAIYEYL